MPQPASTLHLTLSGPDRPGVTASLFAALPDQGVDVLDLEQVVVRGHLTLGVLLAPATEREAAAATYAVEATARRLGLDAQITPGHGDSERRPTGRATVVLMAPTIGTSSVAAFTQRIAHLDGNIDRIRRLSRRPVVAIEMDVSGVDVDRLRSELALVASQALVDVAVAPAGLARSGDRLVVMDVDSTLIQDEVIELLAEHAGRGAEVAAVTERAMRGELDFAASLTERVAALAGLPESVLAEVGEQVRLTPGARTLVRTLTRLGFQVALVSGGFAEIVQPLAADLGIHRVQANRLVIRDGLLTGEVEGPIVDRAGKAAALRRFAAEAELPLSRTVAIGDGANDLDMLAAAGLGVAFNAKPVVRHQADAAVTSPYLDSVLFLLGFSREEIEEADALDARARD